MNARATVDATRTSDAAETDTLDPTETVELLLRDLRTSRGGLSGMEARRRLVVHGRNDLTRHAGPRWPSQLLRQFTHPLALLLWAAAALAFVADLAPIGVAILLVIVVNALFAFIQERHAERAVETLSGYLPARAVVVRDGVREEIDAAELVPGDLLVLTEGQRVPADARLIEGALEVDVSTLTGESVPVARSAELVDHRVPPLEARELVFSGSTCTEGEARALVFATGMRTEIGRIAALSQRVGGDASPLELQVRRVARLIAVIAIVMGVAFVPIAMFGAGLPFEAALVFAIGLLVGNVPEGLLPTITLALAVGVRELAGRGALVKRLSAVETLGSTDVICTDKTGTLTVNRMTATTLWTTAGEATPGADAATGVPVSALATALARANNAEPRRTESGPGASGDPTEVALLLLASELGADVDHGRRARDRVREFHFDPTRKRMSTLDEVDGALWLHAKGAPEAILAVCDAIADADGSERTLTAGDRLGIQRRVEAQAGSGLRVLAVAARRVAREPDLPARHEDAETGMTLLGLVGLLDPPRHEVGEAVARCHAAGIRVHVVSGDHGLTAAAIARRVGIGDEDSPVVTGAEIAAMSDDQLGKLLAEGREIVFARSSPEVKLRIADALKAAGHIVAMTGDGVNDAPALRTADIGIAMGRSGTDVAREAATMVLTDDDFATIVVAIAAGRRVYDNVRKFIFYILAHTTPEVTPFVVFALAGGAIPLPLTVLQLLAFDVGTETLPALALGREPAEPGVMDRPPRRRDEQVIRPGMLVRAWLFVGVIAAVLAMGGFFYVLLTAGWTPGDPTGEGTPFHDAYLQATTMTFLGLVAGQIGTAFAARTDRASLRSVGVLSNRLLLWGIAFEIVVAAAIAFLPPLQDLLDTAAPPPDALALLVAFPLIVWGADELRRWAVRRRAAARDARRAAAQAL